MDADDFQDLYKLLRGSKSAMPVLDAKALYSERKMVAALEKLCDARETFAESRSRVLKQDPVKQVDPKAKDAAHQIKKLKRKQEKLLEILKGFDELIPPLEKLADRERAKQAKDEVESSVPVEQAVEDSGADLEDDEEEFTVARPSDISSEFSRDFSNSEGDERLNVIMDRFGFREVQSEDDLHGDSLYFIQASNQSFLVCTPAETDMGETIALSTVVDDRQIKPFTRKEFLKLGKRRKMVLLTKKVNSSGEGESIGSQQMSAAGGEQDSAESSESSEPSILDMGAFGQLLTAAQRSGLVAGADQIAYVRDREFRMGKYDLAFQAIDAMFSRFTANSTQRAQQLVREDADIAAGRLKMSPKDLQAKRIRDRNQTQEIDRAKRRFQVVLEGLRVLRKTEEGAREATSG